MVKRIIELTGAERVADRARRRPARPRPPLLALLGEGPRARLDARGCASPRASSRRSRGIARTPGGGSRSARATIAPTTNASTGARCAERAPLPGSPATAHCMPAIFHLPPSFTSETVPRARLAGVDALHLGGRRRSSAGRAHVHRLDAHFEAVDLGELVFDRLPASPRRRPRRATTALARSSVQIFCSFAGRHVGLEVRDRLRDFVLLPLERPPSTVFVLPQPPRPARAAGHRAGRQRVAVIAIPVAERTRPACGRATSGTRPASQRGAPSPRSCSPTAPGGVQPEC